MSNLQHSKNIYDKGHDFIHIEHKFSSDYVILMDIAFLSDVFVDLQKDIFHEYFSLLIDRLEEKKEEKDIRHVVEHTLQELNAKLTLFADKINDVEYFTLKGAVRVFYKNELIGSLIGNSSMMIFRDDALHYAVSNDYDNLESIDLFSEFVEGEILSGDEIVLMGYDIHTIFDKSELNKFNKLFSLQNNDLIDFLEEIVSMRIDVAMITYMIKTVFVAPKKKQTNKGVVATGVVAKGAMGYLKNTWNKYTKGISIDAMRYPFVIGVLAILVLILGVGLLSGLINDRAPEMKLSDGTSVTVDIATIKEEIARFNAQPESDQKGYLYKNIIDKLDFLEREGRRVEDVKELRKSATKSYQKIFNMMYVTDFNNFDNKKTGTSSTFLAFNDNEKDTLTDPVRIFANGGKVSVAGTKGFVLDVLDGDRRGVLQKAEVENGDENIKQCTPNLLKNGLYCVTNNDRLYNITKAGTEPLSIKEDQEFPGSITDIGTFGKTNFYTMTRSIYENSKDIYLMRYRNVVGSQTIFSKPTEYPVAVESGTQLDPKTMTIDVSFLMWDSGQVHQWYRTGRGLTLTDRPIKMTGGDNFTYGGDVRIMTNENTRFVLLFDKENQTLTAYDTLGLKTNTRFANTYEMKYLMRFNFNTDTKVIDIALDDTTANTPIVYLLTAKGIYKVSMIEFMESVIEPTR